MPLWLVIGIVFLVLWHRDARPRRSERMPGSSGYIDGRGAIDLWGPNRTVNGGQLGYTFTNQYNTAGVQPWSSFKDTEARF